MTTCSGEFPPASRKAGCSGKTRLESETNRSKASPGSDPLARRVAKPSSDSRTHSGRFHGDGLASRMAAPHAVREVVRGLGSKTAPLTWGRQKILPARIFFAARFFLGADPDCQRGFGRESEPHPVALVSPAPWAQGAGPAPKLAFAVSGCSGMMQAERLRVDPPERGAPV